MDRQLDSLSLAFRPLVFELLARLVERNVAVMVVQTGRTKAEQAQAIGSGHSRILLSKHLPRRMRGILGGVDDESADAIDLCPWDTYLLAGQDKLHWDDDDSPEAKAAFWAIGEEAEKLGLRWGGRWKDPHDPGHVEFLLAGERYKDIPRTSAAWEAHGIISA